MKAIFPTDLVINSLFSFFCPFPVISSFFLTNQKHKSGFQQVVGLVTRNISILCLQQVALYFKTMQYSIEFTFLIYFSCLYCTSMFVAIVSVSILQNKYFFISLNKTMTYHVAYQNYELRIMISNFMFSVKELELWKIFLDEW